MKNLCIMLFLLALVACDADRRKRERRPDLRFRTTDDAELFFKNLRRTEYDHEDLVASKLDVFRHEGRTRLADYPLLVPILAINWRYDEAYLILEANERLGNERPLIIEWRDSLQQKKGRYVLESNNKMEQLTFANQLYRGLRGGQRFYLLTDSATLPFFHNPLDRRVFRITMADYYRLTGTDQ
jgi:hypothetical protein